MLRRVSRGLESPRSVGGGKAGTALLRRWSGGGEIDGDFCWEAETRVAAFGHGEGHGGEGAGCFDGRAGFAVEDDGDWLVEVGEVIVEADEDAAGRGGDA